MYTSAGQASKRGRAQEDRQAGRHRQTDTLTGKQADWEASRQAGRAYTQVGRQADRLRSRQKGGLAGRWTGRAGDGQRGRTCGSPNAPKGKDHMLTLPVAEVVHTSPHGVQLSPITPPIVCAAQCCSYRAARPGAQLQRHTWPLACPGWVGGWGGCHVSTVARHTTTATTNRVLC